MSAERMSERTTPGAGAAPSAGAPSPLPPKELVARLRLAEADIARGEPAAALERLEALMETNPEDGDVLALLGICHHLLGDLEAALSPLISAVRLNPGNARAYFCLGNSLLSLGELDQGYAEVQTGLQFSPRDLDLLVLAATFRARKGAYADASRLLNKALEYHPDALSPLQSLELLGQQTLKKSSVYDQSPRNAEARRRAINRLLAAYRKKRLDSDTLSALVSLLSGSPVRFSTALEIAAASVDVQPMTKPLAQQLILTFWAAGDVARCLRFCEQCYESDPEFSGYREPLCNAWLAAGVGNWNTAWRMLTGSLHSSRPDQHLQDVPLWTGEKLGKKKLIVYQEQGIGDAVIGLRFLPLLAARGIKFDLWVAPALADLAAQAKGYENLIRTEHRAQLADRGYDFAVSLFGLVSALFLGANEIGQAPVVRPAPDQALALRAEVAALPGRKIGLVFGGSSERRDDWMRSVPLDALAQISSIPGISWVNLMIDQRPDRARAIEMFRMLDPMDRVRDFADTAAIVEELDAVIAVDCSVAHIAGNLAKPLWVLVPPSADWRWQMGETRSPWWPSARLLRSDGPGSWRAAAETLCQALKSYVAGE